MQAAILSGGKGTRLSEVSGGLPKPLVEVNGRALLGRQLDLLKASGCTEALVLAGHGAEAVAAYVGDGSEWGMRVVCIAEEAALGTAGAVRAVIDRLEPQFLVLYADTLLDVDLGRFRAAHREGAAATLFLHPNDHPHDSDLVELGTDGRVKAFHPYPHPEGAELPNQVNAALYVLDRDALAGIDGLPERPDFGKHVFPRMLEQGMDIFGYVSPEYIKDAGTPKRLAKVARDLASGRVAARSLRQPQPAVFIDRDGVLNVEKNRISRPEDLVLIPGAATGVARLNDSDYRTAVVTNQPVVARGDCTPDDLRRIHARLDTLLGREGAYVDALYACPHHPDGGFPGEVAELKIVCDCRKPAPGLVRQAAVDLNVDLPGSWMIGDSTVDMELARTVGLRSILVRTGHAGRDRQHPVMPDFVASDLDAAVDIILEGWPAVRGRAGNLAQTLGPAVRVVLLGGAARSGKSTFAGALAIAFRAIGRPASVLSLDHWIKAAGDRGDGVLGRYDLAEAARAVQDLLAGRVVTAPAYDPLERRSAPDAHLFELQPDATLIIEGVPALVSPALGELADVRLHLGTHEETRKSRFFREYERRGFASAEITDLYASRNLDELPVVTRGSVSADHLIET